MTAASAAAATMSATPAAHAARRRSAVAGGSKRGKFLGQLLRAAMRAFGIFPLRRPDQQFTVLPAFFAMKFVYWHKKKLTVLWERTRRFKSKPMKMERKFRVADCWGVSDMK